MRARKLIPALAWLVAVAGWIPPSPAGSPPVGIAREKARRLYVSKCARCHKLYDPESYSEEQWRYWVARMGRKARLDPGQQQDLERYLVSTNSAPRLQAGASGPAG